MKLRQPSLNTIFRGLLFFALVALAYYASGALTSYIFKYHAAALHGVSVGGGVFLTALSLFIAWAELKQRALITYSPHGQKKSILRILLPAGTLLLYSTAMVAFGLSHWWGQTWGILAGVAIVPALLATGVFLLKNK